MKIRRLNEMTRWSNLARLASGNLPRLTIIAPFVAFIILHNEPLQPFLELSENRHPMPVIEYLALARFDIFYLGLVIVGLGVALYSVFSPSQVSHRDGYEGYIKFKENTKTENGVAGSLRLTLDEFVKDAKVADIELRDFGGTARFPRRFREGLHSLMEVAGQAKVSGDVQSDGALANRVLEIMHRRSEKELSAWKRFYAVLSDNSLDVYRLEYIRADYSAPYLRLTVFWTLLIGIGVVLIPTVITTALVFDDLFKAASQTSVPSMDQTLSAEP